MALKLLTYPHHTTWKRMRNPIKSNPSIGTEKRLTRMLEESNNTGASEAGPCILILLPIFEFSTFPFFSPNSSLFQLLAQPSRAEPWARRRLQNGGMAAKEKTQRLSTVANQVDR